ncbi:MAG: DNA-binding response regulator [Acidobacteriaceae bacterium]|nr:DNA-binding response regulator [Acidobacteriaceae bacterium]
MRLASVRILLVDDHDVVRKGLAFILSSQSGWEVCGEASNGRETVEKAGRLRPNIVVLDVSMPVLNGLHAIGHILKAAADTKILVLTLHNSDQILRAVVSAGAKGFVLKSDAGIELIAAIEALLKGQTYFTSKVAAQVLDQYFEGGFGAGRTPGSQN